MEFSAIPLAFLAGVLSLISPCVLPMLPAVTASAMQASKAGLWMLVLGISMAFALAGTLLTFLLLSLGLSTDILRQFSVALMVLMAATLLIPKLNDWVSYWLSRFTGRFGNSAIDGNSAWTQLLVGISLGFVWLPCVGPTLGTAIALASTGQNMLMAFVVMLSFGVGTALPLVWIGYQSGLKLSRWRMPAAFGKKLLGITLLLLALLILTGTDRILEAWALEILPDWVTSI
jgi:cytochrome c-type biogenesis protein